MDKLRKYCLVLCVSALLVACGGSGYRAPVKEGNPLGSVAASDMYTVSTGDTLFSIAWRYGLDYKAVAAANRIPAPYVIFPGQRIKLREEAVPAPVRKPLTIGKTAVRKQVEPSQSRAPKARPSPPPKTPTDTVKKERYFSPDGWSWPAKGKVITAFGSSPGNHKGIDIGGKLEEPVLAAAGGQVVYAGNGILGYGNLLIIKHNDQYLSAYGHNSKLLVREGAQVKHQQRIALKGKSGTDKVKLHFEIRRNGKPVDPIRLLPRR